MGTLVIVIKKTLAGMVALVFHINKGQITTKHIYAQGALIATIEKSPATTTASTFIVHTDHLGGTGAVTDGKGLLVESLTYRPFGAPRVEIIPSAHSSRLFPVVL